MWSAALGHDEESLTRKAKLSEYVALDSLADCDDGPGSPDRAREEPFAERATSGCAHSGRLRIDRAQVVNRDRVRHIGDARRGQMRRVHDVERNTGCARFAKYAAQCSALVQRTPGRWPPRVRRMAARGRCSGVRRPVPRAERVLRPSPPACAKRCARRGSSSALWRRTPPMGWDRTTPDTSTRGDRFGTSFTCGLVRPALARRSRLVRRSGPNSIHARGPRV